MVEGQAELAGNLLCELFNTKEDLRQGLISAETALARIRVIRERRLAAQREFQPQPELALEAAIAA
jgi:hypothetical protein